MSTKATARVTVTLVVDLGQAWGSDCPIGQVHTQATREAREHVERVLAGSKGISIASVKIADVTLRSEP